MKASDMVSKFQYALDKKWGYIFGTSGQLWTAASQAATTDNMAIQYGERWIGHRVADCSGLFSWAADQLGGYLPHGSNSIFRKYTTVTGTDMSATMEPGTAVFKVRAGTKYADKKDYYHIGLYIGGGKVVEAKGTPYGVVTSKLSEWHCWGRLKGVTYDAAAPADPDPDPAVETGPAVVDVPNDGTVNVRAKPSASAKILTRLPEGTRVSIDRIDGDWSLISYAESGYVMTKFLRNGGGGETNV